MSDNITSTKRDLCIAEILYHVKAIRNAYSFYNPAGEYLTIDIHNGHVHFNNAYYDKDADFPLSIWTSDDGDIYDRPTGKVIGHDE